MKNQGTKKAMLRPMALLLAMLFVLCCFAGCDRASGGEQDASEKPTEEPTEVITDEPTEEPTSEPTSEPTEEPTDAVTEEPDDKLSKYNEHDYETILAFLEIKDENGVRNGEKLFLNYDPKDPETWNRKIKNDPIFSTINWTEEGYLKQIYVSVRDDYADETDDADVIIDLRGELILTGLEQIEDIIIQNCNITKVVIKDCNGPTIYDDGTTGLDSLKTVNIGENCPKLNEAYIDNQVYYGMFAWNFNKLYWNQQFPHVGKFVIDLSSDGNGYVSGCGTTDQDYYLMSILAEPKEGYKFAGWYDTDGKLVSNDDDLDLLELDPDHDNYLDGSEFVFTAKFVPIDD